MIFCLHDLVLTCIIIYFGTLVQVGVDIYLGIVVIARMSNPLDEALNLPSGSQLLTVIESHSRINFGKYEVCAQKGAFSLDDSRILEKLGKLKERGIRLAFSDGDCYSGASIPRGRSYPK